MFKKNNLKNWLFLIIVSLQIIGGILLFSSPKIAQAQAGLSLTMEVPIDQKTPTFKFDQSTKPIATYIGQIYNYAIGAVGILAAIMLMVGGLMWIVSGGNTSTVGEAKTIIGASLSGLVLVMTSYLILYQINPSLVNLSADVTKITQIQEEKVTKNLPSLDNATCKWENSQDCWSASGTNHGLIEDDSYCTGTKGDNSQGCCCRFQTLSNCHYSTVNNTTIYANKSCATTEISYSFDIAYPDKDSDAIANCGSDNSTSVCCCSISTTPCDNCFALKQLGYSIQSGACHAADTACQANNDLMTKIANAGINKNDFTITGAWPPSPGAHKVGCHDKGTCVDIKPQSGDVNDLKDLATKLKNSEPGIAYIQYEVQTQARCSTLQPYLAGLPCVVNGSGEHLHVQLYSASN